MRLEQLDEAPVPGKPGSLKGDQSAKAQKKYADNYDAIFRKKSSTPAPKKTCRAALPSLQR